MKPPSSRSPRAATTRIAHVKPVPAGPIAPVGAPTAPPDHRHPLAVGLRACREFFCAHERSAAYGFEAPDRTWLHARGLLDVTRELIKAAPRLLPCPRNGPHPDGRAPSLEEIGDANFSGDVQPHRRAPRRCRATAPYLAPALLGRAVRGPCVGGAGMQRAGDPVQRADRHGAQPGSVDGSAGIRAGVPGPADRHRAGTRRRRVRTRRCDTADPAGESNVA